MSRTEGTDEPRGAFGFGAVLLPVLAPAAVAFALSHRLLTASRLAPASPETEPTVAADTKEELAEPAARDRSGAERHERMTDNETDSRSTEGDRSPLPSQNGAHAHASNDAPEAMDTVADPGLTERNTPPREAASEPGNETDQPESARADEDEVASDRDPDADGADDGVEPAAAEGAVEGDAAHEGTFRLEETAPAEDDGDDEDHENAAVAFDAQGEPATEGEDDEEQRTVAATVTVRRDRSIEKLRQRQKDAAEAAVNNVEDGMVPITPFVRYVNTLTRELTEMHRMVGQVSAERDLLQRQLYQLQGLPVSDATVLRSGKEAKKEAKAEVVASRQELRLDRQEGRAEAKAAKGGERVTLIDGAEIDPDIVDRTLKMGRRRRMIALVVIIALGAGFFFAGRMGHAATGGFSRSSLANISYIGQFVQIFLALWIIYRIGRVGSKGIRFLFPSEEAVYRKQKRREKFLKGAAVGQTEGVNGGPAPQPLGSVLGQSASAEQQQPKRDAGQEADAGQHERVAQGRAG